MADREGRDQQRKRDGRPGSPVKAARDRPLEGAAPRSAARGRRVVRLDRGAPRGQNSLRVDRAQAFPGPTVPTAACGAVPILSSVATGVTILLVDDEESIQKLLTYPLERDGHRVVQARDGEEALSRFREEAVDLVLLDLALPKLDGLEVCRRIRAESTVPILMLTARDDELDKVLGLEIGADDYITKPFSIRELCSRIRAAVRRANLTPPAESAEVIEADGLRMDIPRRTVQVHEQPVQLTYLEFELLRTLASAPGRVFTRQALLDKLWGGSAFRDPRTIDVHVRHLREKIEPDPAEPEYIFTVRGVGYRFRDGR